MADRLEARERLAESLALRRVADGRVERGLCHPDAEGADARPEEVECVHRDRKTTADLSEHLLGPGRDAVEVEPADGVRCDELEMLAREPLTLARDRKGRDPLRAVVGGAGEDGVDVGLGRVGDPELRAGQSEAVAVLLRPELQRRRVRACLGLAERERRDGLPGRELRDPPVA